ncbi:MAG: hypothetical protein KC457_27525, partial [Myxococcales bacterium]|nr:hypothetical protein [Myxococcales bacterium]
MSDSWDRLEPHARSSDLEQGLQARIADPLWLLARQWQVGEFRGEDAASPVQARVVAWVNELERFRNDSQPGALPEAMPSVPLEARVEAEGVSVGPARQQLSGEAGLQLLRRLDAAGHGALRSILREAYPLRLPAWMRRGIPERELTHLRLLARRSFDGRALLRAANKNQLDALKLSPPQRAGLDAALKHWLPEVRERFVEPGRSGDTWADERLEYAFSLGVAAGQGEVVLAARGYEGGHLDWSSFDILDGSDPAHSLGLGKGKVATITSTVVPAPLSYPGMPASRWWSFEEGSVYFGGIEAGPADLARLVVAEFATVYSDDWFLLPLRLPAASLSRIGYIDVVDSFGEVHRVVSAAALDQQRLDKQRPGQERAFVYFELAGDDSAAKGRTPWLFLPPALAGSLESAPVESVSFVRDEAANLGWAVEQLIESPTGKPLARRLRTALAVGDPQEAPADARQPRSIDDEAPWRWRLQTEVPPHWIPLIPERQGDSEQIRLRRARLQGWGSLPDWAVGPQG